MAVRDYHSWEYDVALSNTICETLQPMLKRARLWLTYL